MASSSSIQQCEESSGGSFGFDKPESGRVQSSLPECRTKDTIITAGEKQHREASEEIDQSENKEEFTQTSMVVESSGDIQFGNGMVRLEMTTAQQQNSDFEACIRDIDDALIAASMIMHSVNDDPDSHAVKIGKNLTSNGTISQLLISESGGRDLRSDKGDIFASEMGELYGVSKEGSASPEASFVVSQVGNKNETVVGLNRPNRNKNKSKGPLKNKTGPSPTKPTSAIKRSPSKGIPLNTHEGAREQGGAMQLDNEYVAKRKHEYACSRAMKA